MTAKIACRCWKYTLRHRFSGSSRQRVALYTISTPKPAASRVARITTMSTWRHGAAGSRRPRAPPAATEPGPIVDRVAITRLAFLARQWPCSNHRRAKNQRESPSVLSRSQGDRAERAAGQSFVDPAGDGGGRLAAEPGLLQHHRDGVLGVGRGGERGEHRGVLLVDHLGRTRLARHWKRVEREALEGTVRRP